MPAPPTRRGSVLEDRPDATNQTASQAIKNQDSASTVDEARNRVRAIRAHVEDIKTLIVEAYRARDWLALSYDSWEGYCTAEFGGTIAVPRDERDDLIFTLRDSGMSTRAIEAATGLPKSTVHDIAGVRSRTPAPVLGTDGKTYTPKPELGKIKKLTHALDQSEQAEAEIRQRATAEFGVSPSELAMADMAEEVFEESLKRCRDQEDMSAENVIRKGRKITDSNTKEGPRPKYEWRVRYKATRSASWSYNKIRNTKAKAEDTYLPPFPHEIRVERRQVGPWETVEEVQR